MVFSSRVCTLTFLFALFVQTAPLLWAQTPQSTPAAATPPSQSVDPPPAPEVVKVVPEAQDAEIAARLEKILIATEWFRNCDVRVDEGVVILEGETSDAKYKDWATNLAQKTTDVVAVVNHIQLTPRAIWDLSPAWVQIQEMGRGTIQGLPLFGTALVVIILTWIMSKYFSGVASRAIGRRTPNPILQQVGSRAIVIPVILIGIYLALRISGLTQIAATVVGGTGLIGLIVGIAFRDIAENFLASILISMQRPFQLNDLIEVNGVQGIVQSVTTRGTLLITLDGNHVQIPNSSIYKSVIQNLTANPRLRLQFSYPVTGKISPETAQVAIMEVLKNHDAVQGEPEPLVLVDEVTAAGFVLKIYFWIDGRAFSSVKVKSAVLRRAHETMQKVMQQNESPASPPREPSTRQLNGNAPHQKQEADFRRKSGPAESVGEGGLHNEQIDLEKQVKACARVDESPNLLKPAECPPDSSTAEKSSK